MEKITLFVCRELLIKSNNFKLVYANIFLFFGWICLTIKYGINAVSIVGTVMFIVISIFIFVWQKRRDNKLKNNQFYIAEDVFINLKRRKVWTKYTGKYENCTLKFSRNGTYDVNIYEKREPKTPSCDYSAVNFSKPGDKCYLLMIPGKNKNIILKCFNAKYYEMFEPDFDYIDGKYYPKKHIL